MISQWRLPPILFITTRKENSNSILKRRGSILVSVIPEGLVATFGDGLALTKILTPFRHRPSRRLRTPLLNTQNLPLYPLFTCLPSSLMSKQSRAQYNRAV
jgi:hypothetical protein